MRKRRKFKSICCLFILALLLLSACGAAETAKETAGGSTPPAVSNAHEDAELEYAYFSEALRPFDEGFDVCGAARLDGERLAVLGADADSAKLLILSYAPGESGRPEFSELASTQPETPAIDDTHRLNVCIRARFCGGSSAGYRMRASRAESARCIDRGCRGCLCSCRGCP